jgi:nucleoside-diphosphate-sugar epimerase
MAINDLIRGFEEALGKKAIIDHQPFHAGDMTSTQADISKAGRLLDWRPQVKPADGLQRTVEWYRANRSWLKDIRL